MYLRADEKPVSRFTPPVRGVPNVVVYQQHPGDGTRRPPAPALVARRGRGDKAALLPAKQNKVYFDFEEIARRIAGKGKYACREERIEAPYRFNFARTTTVSGCPVTASLMDIFGKEWLREIRSLYLLGDGKTEEQVLNDIWHALFSFKDEERLRDWACENSSFRKNRPKRLRRSNFRRIMPP